jgi:hypothetical protein
MSEVTELLEAPAMSEVTELLGGQAIPQFRQLAEQITDAAREGDLTSFGTRLSASFGQVFAHQRLRGQRNNTETGQGERRALHKTSMRRIIMLS